MIICKKCHSDKFALEIKNAKLFLLCEENISTWDWSPQKYKIPILTLF